MQKHVLVVMTNCAPGTDAEFNDWYDSTHIPDVLRVPGIVAAQRFKLNDRQRRDTRPEHRYLALYEIESDNLPDVFQAMSEGLQSVYKSPTLQQPTWAYFYTPIAERQVKTGGR